MAKKQLREFLAGLDNAVEVELKIKQALEEAGCKIFIDDGKENRYIPKNRLDAKIAELAEANEQIDTLEKQVKGSPDAQNKIKELETQIENMKAEAKNTQIKNAINTQALEAKARDVEDLMKFLDMEKVQLKEDGTVEGLKEQIEALQKDKAYLFEVAEQGGGQPQQNPPSFFGTGSPGKPSNLNAFGSKTTHEGDFGKLLGQQAVEQAKQIDSDYFFK